MPVSIQAAMNPLFNAAEVPPAFQRAWQSHGDLLVACPKKSVFYYLTEENGSIPWWTLLCSLPPTHSYHVSLWEGIWQRIAIRLDRRRPVCVVVEE